MESHVLNMYHQARYRTIGHKVMHSMSESLSSEGSCNQNSPEYSQDQESGQYEEESSEGTYWDAQNSNLWSQNQKINITKSLDSSIDEDVDVQDISIDEKALDSSDHEVEPDNMEDNSLVEGADYDVIQVFAVDPDLELEGSSEEEEQEEEYEDANDDEVDGEYLTVQEKPNYTESNNLLMYTHTSTDSICQDNLGINLDTPVVSNVDEYFIKENKDKDILAVKDEPVVKDVDEYFIKNVKEPTQPTVEDNFLISTKLPEDTDFRIAKDVPNVEEFFAAVQTDKVDTIKDIITPVSIVPEVEPELPLNVSDLEVLPNIEDLKRYLLEDIPYNKLKSAQRSCSVPHSPMHNLCVDIDSKTCLSFEDLNLDLSDLSFENVKDKSNTSSKSDDMPRTLTEEDVNSFLITPASVPSKENDDLSPQDMEIDKPIESLISTIDKTSDLKSLIVPQDIPIQSLNLSPQSIPVMTPILLQDKTLEHKVKTTVPKLEVCEEIPLETIFSPLIPLKATKVPKAPVKQKPTVLDFCIEKNNIKKESEVKIEIDDFVDVESCNDTVIPVLEANNLNSLLEQFEATEKLNTKSKTTATVEPKAKNCLTNGMRLQDAGVQLNKTKMRQILMPSTINTTTRRSPSPVHSDHDYCSTKKRHSLPNIKGGRSLLKPEVLSSNHRILSSRHRSCKNKKIVYHQSSDEESEKCSDVKKIVANPVSDDDSDIKKRNNVKQPLKTAVNANYRKKVSPVHFFSNDSIDKSNGSVMAKSASKASDTASSQNSNGSIKLTIKNKSEVIIKTCDSKDNHKIKIIEKDKSSSVAKSVVSSVEDAAKNRIKKPKQFSEKEHVHEKVKEDSKSEDFYVTLFSDKKDVQLPLNISKNTEKRCHDDVCKISPEPPNVIEIEQPQKKKKLNLQEYKLRRGASSNNSSAQVSPEAIFPEMPCNIILEKDPKTIVNQKPISEESNIKTFVNSDTSKKIFDPIREASRKILMNSKKQKAEAMRKRDEDIVMSKIPKVENLELQPLISDAEMLKIVGMSGDSMIPVQVSNEIVQQPSKDYDEIILVSVGTNTDENLLKKSETLPLVKKQKSQSPSKEKATINFKIKKTDHVLKQNVFESMKNERSPDDKKPDIKLDEERYKGITATLKSVEKQVDTKISSNSLFASIQDVVMKKATTVAQNASNSDHKHKSSSPVYKQDFKFTKPVIVRDYDENADHGEDKIILHLEKKRIKPELSAVNIQTDCTDDYKPLTIEIFRQETPKEQSISPRKRNDSDMSMSSEGSPVRIITPEESKHREKSEKSPIKEKRSRSKDRHDLKYRRSRSNSRGLRRNRSRSRTRSRSRGRFRRYRRSDSPYRRKRRSRTPYGRRSPSLRRDYRSNRSRSRSRYVDSKSPIVKKQSPQKNDKKFIKSMTPPIRKPTVSESSDTSTSSSSSSGSSSSGSSGRSRRASSAFRRTEIRNKSYRKSFSSEDRESNTPVEERRIVFVGRLEKDVTKASLRSQFCKFGPVTEVRLHSKEDGTRYGFVTYQRPRDAWSAVEAAATFPQYDVGFGGRRAFCRQSYADLDGLEAKYTESAFHGQAAAPPRRNDDMSFEQMLLDIKKKLNKRKGDKRTDDTA